MPLALKRITKELSNINDKDYLEHTNYSREFKNYLGSLTIFLTNTHNDPSANHLVIKEKDKLFLELSIPQTYPFKSYKIVNYSSTSASNSTSTSANNTLCYYKYMNNVSAKIANYDKSIIAFFYKTMYNCEHYFLKLKKYDCYCCSSIMCSNLWCPAYTFVNIILEHLEISFIDRYSSPINYKYLVSIYNGIFSRLAPEISDLIISYL
jgi:hypothetical protein